MDDSASCQRKQHTPCMDMNDGGGNASGYDIIGSSKPHKKNFTVPRFRNKYSGKLCHKDLVDRYEKITQIALGKQI